MDVGEFFSGLTLIIGIIAIYSGYKTIKFFAGDEDFFKETIEEVKTSFFKGNIGLKLFIIAGFGMVAMIVGLAVHFIFQILFLIF